MSFYRFQRSDLLRPHFSQLIRFYSGYVQFFTDFVKDHGIPDTLEQFIFFDKYNVGAGSEKPWMLSRFLSGVLHPMIHVGYGAEFELPGMLVEGKSSGKSDISNSDT